MKLITAIWPDKRVGPGVFLPAGGALCLADLNLDLTGAKCPSSFSMLDVIRNWDEIAPSLHEFEQTPPGDAKYELDELQLLAPLPEPPQIRDFACYETHVRQARTGFQKLLNPDAETVEDVPPPPIWYEQPIYYKANRFAVCGTDTQVVWPRASNVIDYELELAMVIGKPGRNIKATEASAHIFGFTIFNDFSARDLQIPEMAGTLGPTKSKDFDNSNAFGPCLVTADEIADPYALKMTARVNGEIRSEGYSEGMHWSFEQLIEFVSRDETLHAGEILGSGTVGNGCGLELMRFLEDGDTIELEIEGIGTLRNTVRRET